MSIEDAGGGIPSPMETTTETASTTNNKRLRSDSRQSVDTSPSSIDYTSDGDAILNTCTELTNLASGLTMGPQQKAKFDEIIEALKKNAASVNKTNAFFACKLAKLEQSLETNPLALNTTPMNYPPNPFSYANALRNPTLPAQNYLPRQKQYSIFIKHTDNMASKDLLKEIQTKIIPGQDNIQISKSTIINHSVVKLTTTSEEKAKDLTSKLNSRIENLEIQKEKLLNPRIMLFKVPVGIINEELIEQLYENNSHLSGLMHKEDFATNVKVVRRTKTVDDHHSNVILEISPKIRSLISLPLGKESKKN